MNNLTLIKFGLEICAVCVKKKRTQCVAFSLLHPHYVINKVTDCCKSILRLQVHISALSLKKEKKRGKTQPSDESKMYTNPFIITKASIL